MPKSRSQMLMVSSVTSIILLVCGLFFKNSVVILANSGPATIQCLNAPGLPVSPIAPPGPSPLHCFAHGTGQVPWQRTCFWFCAAQQSPIEERGGGNTGGCPATDCIRCIKGGRSQGWTVGIFAGAAHPTKAQYLSLHEQARLIDCFLEFVLT